MSDGCNRYDITIVRGCSWLLPLTWTEPNGSPRDLTNYEAQMMIRPALGSPIVIAHLKSNGGTFAPDALQGVISLGGTAGTIVPALTDAQTLLISSDYEGGVYDLKVKNPSGGPDLLLEGSVCFELSVTEWL